MGQVHTGKGVAKKALLNTIVDLDIKEVKAKTTTNNIASQKVLEQNGFEHTETSDKEFEMNGQINHNFYHQSDAAVKAEDHKPNSSFKILRA